MLNTQLLNDIISKSGYKKNYIAQQLNLTAYGLALKIAGENEFKASEIYKISELLNLSSQERDLIFFSEFSELNSTK